MINGNRCRFIERELEGDKWEVLGPDFGSSPREAIPTEQTVKPAGLIERLEAAEVGSRELDAFLLTNLDSDRVSHSWEECVLMGHDNGFDMLSDEALPPVTTSLDAALELAERVLGDEEWMVVKSMEDGVTSYHAAAKPEILSQAKTAPLALCIAILRATGDQ